jgi:Matrixin
MANFFLRATALCVASAAASFSPLHADEAEVKLPVITLAVRVHLVQSDTMPAMHTTLTEPDIRRIIGKVNKVWAQAGIQFEIESIGPTTAIPLKPGMEAKPEFDRVHAMIPRERLSATALDVCYVKEVKPNGFYYGEPVVVKDTASLRQVPGGLDEPLPRVTSHEIGHALGLPHRQDTTNLMASGTTGFSLNDAEIAIARAKAQERLDKIRAIEKPQ